MQVSLLWRGISMAGFGPLWADTVATLFMNVVRRVGASWVYSLRLRMAAKGMLYCTEVILSSYWNVADFHHGCFSDHG